MWIPPHLLFSLFSLDPGFVIVGLGLLVVARFLTVQTTICISNSEVKKERP